MIAFFFRVCFSIIITIIFFIFLICCKEEPGGVLACTFFSCPVLSIAVGVLHVQITLIVALIRGIYLRCVLVLSLSRSLWPQSSSPYY